MKQVKHNNVFVYYAKYESFWATLKTEYTPPPSMKNKNTKIF